MATSLGEYLHTSYRPDREYIDGEVLERHVGKWTHARVQALLAAWFGSHEAQWNILVATDVRMQVTPTRVRIADLAVVSPGVQPAVLTEPPLLVVDIRSPEDTFAEMFARSVDCQRMGVRSAWIIDPDNLVGHALQGRDRIETRQTLEVSGTAINLDLPRLFENLYQNTTLL